jgi:glycosyltransferase involved in cell wall biosynthesis
VTGPVEPRPAWSRERQPDPPNFGEAELVSRERLERVVQRRRRKAEPILERAREICDFEPGLVSLIVLTYARLPELRRLCDGLVPLFERVEDYPKLERILIDNGSGPEVGEYARPLSFFDEIVVHPVNIGMPAALDDAYRRCRGEYILFVEDDFIVDYDRPFVARAIGVLEEYPEIGIVRLKNQNNWWKPFRRIGPLRSTTSGTEFWTWLPSRDRRWNVWAAGSVLFRKASFFSTGPLPVKPPLLSRKARTNPSGGVLYEEVYGRRYNRTWLAAKIKDVQPFVQPNDNLSSELAAAAAGEQPRER